MNPFIRTISASATYWVLGLALNLRADVVYSQEVECQAMQVVFPVALLPMDSLMYLQGHHPPPRWYDFVGNMPRDLGLLVGTSVDNKTIPALVGITALTLGLVATDHETYKLSSGFYERSRAVADVSD